MINISNSPRLGLITLENHDTFGSGLVFNQGVNFKVVLMKEEWRPVVGYEDIYEVSNMGRIRRLDRGTFLKPYPNQFGYFRVCLSKNSKGIHHAFHKVVCLAFIGPRPEKMHIDHIDGDKSNNFLSNLEYVTCRENASRAFARNKNKTSKYTGVCWSKKERKWISSLDVDGKKIRLGGFQSEEDARYAYINKLREIER